MKQQRFIRSGENKYSLPVRLILCFDGTGDTAEGSYSFFTGTTKCGSDSIYAIHNMVKTGLVSQNDNLIFQHTEYFEGIGTQNKQKDAAGTINGYGFLEILQNAYKVCCEMLKPGKKDEIFLFGFSRGAFIARALASFLQHVGLINPEHLCNFTQLFNDLVGIYGKLKGTKDPHGYTSKSLMPYCRPSPRVRFIGAFDTVKGKFFYSSNEVDFEMDAPDIVDNFRHALALNEDRNFFEPDMWKSPTKPGSSYEQAWFFGHHHDIGGGSAQQGLALWPLQWILQSARECGLALDDTAVMHKILFSGAPKTVDTYHKLSMGMTDMIKHHRSNTSWALRLNPPFSLEHTGARKFSSSVTKQPPDPNCHELKTYIHPSAYLIFDVSSSFRIQVQEWEGLRGFMAARASTLKQVLPWWEQWAIEHIREEVSSVKHLNIFIYGRPQTGKVDLIGQVFGSCYSGNGGSQKQFTNGLAEDHEINTPLSIPDNDKVQVYYSNGFGADRRDTGDGVARFLAQYRGVPNSEPGKKLHAVWFFVDRNKSVLDHSDKEFLKMDFGDTPVHIILGKDFHLDDQAKKELGLNTAIGCGASPSAQAKQVVVGGSIGQVKEVQNAQAIGAGDTKVRIIVRAGTPDETLKALSRETFASMDNPVVRNALIKAQRVLVGPKISLAIEESIRAYMIWHSFKFEQKKIKFSRNKEGEGLSLPLVLIEPILATFNTRFPSDDTLIQLKVGGGWSGLGGHNMGLHDTTAPGGLILMCMIDTIIVMIRALSHQKVSGRLRELADPVQPLHPADIDDACKWYTSPKNNRQVAMHKKIESMLLGEGLSPQNRSITALQMKLIEAVELESEEAVADTISIFWRIWKYLI